MITLMYWTINKGGIILKLVKANNQLELFTVINIRKTVFIDEQKVPLNEELDDKDYTAEHFLISNNNNEYVGTARYYIEDNKAIIGRVAILKEHRKKGYASYLIKEMMKDIKSQNISIIHIGAQKQALSFYETLGFKVCGELYLDANIEHYPMEVLL